MVPAQDIFKDIRFLILHHLYVSGIPQVKLCYYYLPCILGFMAYEDCTNSNRGIARYAKMYIVFKEQISIFVYGTTSERNYLEK